MPHAWPASGRTGAEHPSRTRAEPGPTHHTGHATHLPPDMRSLWREGPARRPTSRTRQTGETSRGPSTVGASAARPRIAPAHGLRWLPARKRRRRRNTRCAGRGPTTPTGCMQPQEGATNLRVQVRPDDAHCPAEAGEPSTKATHCRTAATGRGGTPACTAPVSPSDDVGCDGGNASCYMTPLRRMARRPAAPSSISTTEEGSGVGRLGSTVPPL